MSSFWLWNEYIFQTRIKDSIRIRNRKVNGLFLTQGRTFSSLIQKFVDIYKPLNETYLPLYETEAGRKIYDETLACVEQQFPGYVKEIQGTADGANVPFHKVHSHVRCFITFNIFPQAISRVTCWRAITCARSCFPSQIYTYIYIRIYIVVSQGFSNICIFATLIKRARGT